MKLIFAAAVLAPLLLLTLLAWATVCVGLDSLLHGGWTPTSPVSFLVWCAIAAGVTLLLGYAAKRFGLRFHRPAQVISAAVPA